MAKTHEMDLCEGSLWKKILIFSIPLMFSNILQVLFNMSDVAVVGKFAGPIALGAVGSTSILVTLFTGLLIGLASGVNALTALYIGSKSEGNRTYRRYFMPQCRGFDLRSGHPLYPPGSYPDAHKGGADRRRRSLPAPLSARHARPCRFQLRKCGFKRHRRYQKTPVLSFHGRSHQCNFEPLFRHCM